MLKGLSYYTLSTISVGLIKLFITLYLSTLLSPAQFAPIGVFSALLYGMAPLTSMHSINLVSLNIVEKDKAGYQLFKKDYIAFVLNINVVVLAIVLIIIFFTENYSNAIIASFIVGFFTTFQGIHNAELVQNQKAKIFAFYAVTNTMLLLLLVFLTVDVLKLGTNGYFISICTSMGGTLFISILVTNDVLSFLSLRITRKAFNKIFVYGLPLTFTVGATWIMTQSDKYIVSRFFNEELLGKYSFAYLLGVSYQSINRAIVNTISPIIFRSLNSNPKRKTIIKYFFYMALFTVVLISTISTILIVFKNNHLFPGYLDEIEIILLILLASGFDGLFRVPGLVIDYYRLNVLKARILYFAAIMNVSVSLLLLPKFGLIAPALGTVLSYILLTILTIYFAFGKVK
jgi:O-antigen/teichoic acid export membrane protein